MKVFRVWDESTNTMYYPGHDGTQLVFGITCAYGEEGHHTWQLWDAEGEIAREGKAELMQHTGLRDKDWCEIYEGDIVEYMSMTFYVVFHKQAFGWFEGEDFIAFTNMARCQLPKLEIIGNIHEHPHLLEVSE